MIKDKEMESPFYKSAAWRKLREQYLSGCSNLCRPFKYDKEQRKLFVKKNKSQQKNWKKWKKRK
ncbi:hypothetical protein ACQVP6_08405 [Bacillus cereus]|uniref:hypothetical protein n=1 Tax=Bacillus cereus TaxID=1396 RepID=UPI003D647FB8